MMQGTLSHLQFPHGDPSTTSQRTLRARQLTQARTARRLVTLDTLEVDSWLGAADLLPPARPALTLALGRTKPLEVCEGAGRMAWGVCFS